MFKNYITNILSSLYLFNQIDSIETMRMIRKGKKSRGDAPNWRRRCIFINPLTKNEDVRMK